MRFSPGKLDKYLVFREDFRDLKSVADNGGVVTGTPTILNGYTTTGANSQRIAWPNKKGILNNATKFILDLDFTTGSDITSYTDLLTEWDGSGTLQFMAQIISGSLVFYLGGAANYGGFVVAANTRYRIRYSYDGSQATNALKLVCYKDGAAQALSFSGTIPTSVPVNLSYILTANGLNNATSTHVSGVTIRNITIYKGISSTLDEALDAYQQDTYSEIDASKALVYLPLKSWYYKENGTNLLVDMLVASYGVGNSATLTNPTTDTLRVAYNGSANAYGYQTKCTTGKRYKITGQIAGDGAGTSIPKLIFNDGTVIFTGTNSATLQNVSVEMVATNPTIGLYNFSASGYCDFKDIRVELMEARTENIGSLGGYALLGDGSTSTTFPTQLSPKGMSFDGGDYIDTSVVYNDSAQPFSIVALLRFGSVSGTQEIFGNFDGTNGISLREYGGDYFDFYVYKSASDFIRRYQTSVDPKPGELYTLIVTYDGSGVTTGMVFYQDGIYLASNGAAAGSMGAFSSTNGFRIGARKTASPGNFLASGGKIYASAYYPFALTPTQVRAVHNQLMKSLNV